MPDTQQDATTFALLAHILFDLAGKGKGRSRNVAAHAGSVLLAIFSAIDRAGLVPLEGCSLRMDTAFAVAMPAPQEDDRKMFWRPHITSQEYAEAVETFGWPLVSVPRCAADMSRVTPTVYALLLVRTRKAPAALAMRVAALLQAATLSGHAVSPYSKHDRPPKPDRRRLSQQDKATATGIFLNTFQRGKNRLSLPSRRGQLPIPVSDPVGAPAHDGFTRSAAGASQSLELLSQSQRLGGAGTAAEDADMDSFTNAAGEHVARLYKSLPFSAPFPYDGATSAPRYFPPYSIECLRLSSCSDKCSLRSSLLDLPSGPASRQAAAAARS